MKYLFFLLVLGSNIFLMEVSGQIIPEDRIVDWEQLSKNIKYVQPAIQLNVMDYGATGDGITDDYQAIMDAIESLEGYYGFIYFPPGNYVIKEPIILPDSCILKGESSKSSILTFNLEDAEDNCISISRPQSSEFVSVSGGLNKGSNLISVDNIMKFNPGDNIEITQKNGDWDVVPISWASNSVGQMTRVIAIVDNKLLLESKLRIDYSVDLEPKVRPVYPITNSGLQCIKIRRIDETGDGSGSNIFVNMAAHCYFRGIESDSSKGSHISIYSGLNILIEGSYFHHAYNYDGEGMNGYGITLSNHTSECLITNNILRKLRHAMMIKTGSNGNIFSYNYSLEPLRTEPIPDASGDISFHGHYAFSNLWEGNIVQNIVIDHYWGPSGPYNTLFRNRAELYGIIMTANNLQETNMQNFVGNETTNTNIFHGLYSLTGEEHFEYGNNILGQTTPPGSNDLYDSSYYLSDAPGFWSSLINWPPIGIPNQLGTGTIPAKLRYISGSDFTICPDSLITDYDDNEARPVYDFKIWPVPVNSILNIEVTQEWETPLSIYLSDTYGNTSCLKEVIDNAHCNISVSIDNLDTGIYFITLRSLTVSKTKKLIVIN
jgi:pectate lyase-like protein/type IX secretion system substrate protein